VPVPKRSTEIVARAYTFWGWLTGAQRFNTLPVLCGARDPSNNQPIAIWRGERGYFLWTESKSPEEWNEDHDITRKQVAAMLEGSVLGWRCSPPTSDATRR
jgi:hypothetical protein